MDGVYAVRRQDDVVSRKVGDRLVVVDLQTNRIYELNPTASRLWELLETGRDRAELEQAMLKEFEVREPDLSVNLDETLNLLSAKGLIAEYEPA
ncbi:MAG TPA: PqqD family protein [Thermoleophilaceae bacterium]|nr:PqqD family protein [Thermoleophilaceae bacterium]